MSRAQLVITAVVLEGRSKSAVARDYDVSRQWVHQLVNHYKTDGTVTFLPRSRRPPLPMPTYESRLAEVPYIA
jgi:transposase